MEKQLYNIAINGKLTQLYATSTFEVLKEVHKGLTVKELPTTKITICKAK